MTSDSSNFYLGINKETYKDGIIRPNVISKDKDNNVYIAGFVSTDYLPGEKVFIKNRHYNASTYYGYLIKTSSTGEVIWSTFIPDEVKFIFITKDNNLLLISATVIKDFNFPITNNYYYTNTPHMSGLSRFLIISLDFNGNLNWATLFASGISNYLENSKLLISGELVLFGKTDSKVYPFANVENESVLKEGKHYFMASFSKNGSFLTGAYLINNQNYNLYSTAISESGELYALVAYIPETDPNHSYQRLIKFSSNFTSLSESSEEVLSSQVSPIIDVKGISIINSSLLIVYGSKPLPEYRTPWLRLISLESLQKITEFEINPVIDGYVSNIIQTSENTFLTLIYSIYNSTSVNYRNSNPNPKQSFILLTEINSKGINLSNTFYGLPSTYTEEVDTIPLSGTHYLILSFSSSNLVVFSVDSHGKTQTEVNFKPDIVNQSDTA